MKNALTILALAVTFSAVNAKTSVPKESDHTCNHTFCVLKSSGNSNPSFIPPRHTTSKGDLQLHAIINGSNVQKSGSAVFEFTYADSVTEQTKTAATYAANLWSALLTTDVPIGVYVREASQESSTLASAGPANLYLMNATSYSPVHWDPAAIAERKVLENLSEEDVDIIITVNQDQEFYYGTDGNCPADKHDLVSILLHELGHGLGLTNTLDVTPVHEGDDTATYGINGYAMAYDHFLTDDAKTPILEGVLPGIPSTDLASSLMLEPLFFTGPLTLSVTNNEGAKIYKPIRWNAGSSASHLDEATYVAGDPNSLMTPQADMGEVIHDPGPIAMAMLGDIGWDHVSITHQNMANTEDLNALLNFEVNVRADAEGTNNPIFYYRIKGTEDPFLMVPMAARFAEGQFFLPFQLPGVPVEYEYYLSVNTSANRVFTYPAGGIASPISFKSGPDFIGPTITHVPEPFHYSNRQILTLSAEVTDDYAIGNVSFDIWLNETYVGNAAATPSGSGVWTTAIGMPDMSQSSFILYRINATDTAIAQNTSIYPAQGFNRLKIEKIYAPTNAYSNNLDSTGANDFILDGFEVKTLDGFTSASLGTLHPYANNGDENNGDPINSYAYLRQPIIAEAGMKLSFDEIVLVEPGAEDVAFGDQDFWDYVTVEVSTNRGRSWTPITVGWDSSDSADWSTAFNNGINSEDEYPDSTTEGTVSMFRNRVIEFDDSDAISPGDELMIRFRLYSDQFVTGWGWEIDNIVIGL